MTCTLLSPVDQLTLACYVLCRPGPAEEGGHQEQDQSYWQDGAGLLGSQVPGLCQDDLFMERMRSRYRNKGERIN